MIFLMFVLSGFKKLNLNQYIFVYTVKLFCYLMSVIDEKAVIILEFNGNDRTSTTYDQLFDFDYIRGLVTSKAQNSSTKICENPPVYLVDLSYDSKLGFTSNVFSIIHQYLKTKKFFGLSYQNIETVIKFLIDYAIPCNYCNDIDNQLLITVLNTTTNIHYVLAILKNNTSKFVTSKTVDFCRILNLFDQENINDFYNICGNLHFDCAIGNTPIILDENINGKVYNNDKYSTLVLNLSVFRRESKLIQNTMEIFTYSMSINKALHSMNPKTIITITLLVAAISSNTSGKLSCISVYKLNNHTKTLLNKYNNMDPTLNSAPKDIFILNDEDTHFMVTVVRE